jgi:hypothetical protein
MTKDIATHIEHCNACQHRKEQYSGKDEILSPLPLCTQRNHVDLFGPLSTKKARKWLSVL